MRLFRIGVASFLFQAYRHRGWRQRKRGCLIFLWLRLEVSFIFPYIWSNNTLGVLDLLVGLRNYPQYLIRIMPAKGKVEESLTCLHPQKECLLKFILFLYGGTHKQSSTSVCPGNKPAGIAFGIWLYRSQRNSCGRERGGYAKIELAKLSTGGKRYYYYHQGYPGGLSCKNIVLWKKKKCLTGTWLPGHLFQIQKKFT